MSGLELRLPKISTPADLASRMSDAVTNPAKWMHERLVRLIIAFEERLDDSQEVGARLVTFGEREPIHIENVSHWAPDLVLFFGRNLDGHPVELIQHVTQVSVLLVALPKVHEKPRRIGFDLERSLDQPSADSA